MSGDAMKLVRYVCTAKAHADGRSDAALTIHEGAWAFCPSGAKAAEHHWEASDGLPISDAMRFTPRQPAAASPPTGEKPPAPGSPAAAAKSKGRAR